MIWYTEELTCQEQPDGATLNLTGTFNAPGSNIPMIQILLMIEQEPGDTLIIKPMMEKSPSFLSFEEPNPDEIHAKYYRQVLKARDKIIKTPYQDLLGW